tara:strand:- start:394 stop:642 length:249 start_codon:yes stop_codon:yes gene_type:complete
VYNLKNTNKMKIKANKVKQGMTVGWGVVTITVERVEESYQKNGKQLITLYGSATRSHGRGIKPTIYPTYDITPKGETFLNLK